MGKRPHPKNHNAVKQSAKREPQSVNLASGKRPPSNARSTEYLKGAEAIGEISLAQIPLKSGSQHPSCAPDGAVDQVIDRATDVIGNREEAMRWLGMPVRGLDFATPISLLTTEEGAERVNDILGQMEHGIW